MWPFDNNKLFDPQKHPDIAGAFEYSNKIGLKINLYPDVLLLLKRGYLRISGGKITVTDGSGSHNIFKFKKGKYLKVMDSDSGTYTTYYPKHARRHLSPGNYVNGNHRDEARVFISNEYSFIVNGHTNIAMVTNEGDHHETTEIHFSKRYPSPVLYVETLAIPTGGVLASDVYGGHEGEGGITNAIGVVYSTKDLALHLKTDAFIDSLVQKMPEMERKYSALSVPIYKGFNCTRYALYAVSNINEDVNRLLGVNRTTFSPGQFGNRVKNFAESNDKKLEYEVFIKNPDGSPVNKESIKFFRFEKRPNQNMLYVDGGDSRGKRIQLDDEHVIDPDLNYILWKIYNNETKFDGRTYTITADPALDMKHVVPRHIEKPLKPEYVLEIGSLKIDSATVRASTESRINIPELV